MDFINDALSSILNCDPLNNVGNSLIVPAFQHMIITASAAGVMDAEEYLASEIESATDRIEEAMWQAMMVHPEFFPSGYLTPTVHLSQTVDFSRFF